MDAATSVKAMGILLTVVIPAYNEAERLPPYLREIRDHLAGSLSGDYEVIVIDDGSRDGMADVLRRSFVDWPQLSIRTHPDNLGKGAAVRTGILAARGDLALFADADGASPIAEERKLRAAIDDGADIAIGSRLLAGRSASVTRRMHRDIPGRIFAGVARSLFGLPILDLQCGFKMFRHDVARRLFESCRVDGYVFDVAILDAARRLGYRTVEVPVRWKEVPGSKFDLVFDSCRMAWGLIKLRMSSRKPEGVSAASEDLQSCAGSGDPRPSDSA